MAAEPGDLLASELARRLTVRYQGEIRKMERSIDLLLGEVRRLKVENHDMRRQLDDRDPATPAPASTAS